MTQGAMTEVQQGEFLAQPWIARLATVKPDGSPYIVPIWYQWDGSNFLLVARARAAFVDYIGRDPRVALSVARDDPYPPIRVLVEGRAEIAEGPCVRGRWVDVARDMCLRYRGEEGLRYIEKTLNRPRWLIRIVPEKVTSWAGAEWHPRYL